LKVRDQIAQLFDRSALKEALTLDHDEDIELVRWEAPRDLFERFEFGCVGSKELAEGIVDLDSIKPNAAAINNTMAVSPTRSGKRKEINPMRSRPSVRGLFAW
jgi:hypothetical protein